MTSQGCRVGNPVCVYVSAGCVDLGKKSCDEEKTSQCSLEIHVHVPARANSLTLTTTAIQYKNV